MRKKVGIRVQLPPEDELYGPRQLPFGLRSDAEWEHASDARRHGSEQPEEEAVVVLPSESKASRSYPLRSIRTFRGAVVDHRRGTTHNYESKLERDFISLLLVDPLVEDIQEQPPAVAYKDDGGRGRTHTFDFLIRRAGQRIAVDIKPSDRVAKSGIERVQELIKEQTGISVADKFIVQTEQHLHPDDVRDAELIARARRLPNPAADAAARILVTGLAGRACLGSLIEHSGLGAAAFNALVRLIGDRVLEVCDDAPITHSAIIRRRPS